MADSPSLIPMADFSIEESSDEVRDYKTINLNSYNGSHALYLV